jgi:hypothetical protein
MTALVCHKCMNVFEAKEHAPGFCEECHGVRCVWCPGCWSTVQALQPDGDPFEPEGCRKKQATPARLKAMFFAWDPRLENTSTVVLNVDEDVPYVWRTYRRGETVPRLPRDMLVLTVEHAHRLFEFEQGPST